MQETQEMQVRSLGQEDPCNRIWQPTTEATYLTHIHTHTHTLYSVFLPGKFHGQRRLAGCSPWGEKELDTTERTHASPETLAPIILYFPGPARASGLYPIPLIPP